MPRAQVAGREIRRRSRNGCWNCKARKVKCGEEKPRCSNCERLDEDCDYKIRLSWGGRPLKKKQLENGANGQDPAGDDQSQSIPGAGQFSINQQHFPPPPTFIPPSNSNGTPRKPPVPRTNNGKRTTMSNYQTVFAVGEMPAPPPPATAPHKSHADPQLTVSIPATSQSQNQPRPVPQSAGGDAQSRQQNGSYGWQQGLTPSTPTQSANSSFDDGRPRNDSTAFYSPYPNNSAPFTPQTTTSPTSHFGSHSPTGTMGSSSPESMYAQPLGSPQQQHQHQHQRNHPPPIMTMTSPPSKKVRTTTSPTQPPPNSPFIYGRRSGYPVSSLAPHTSIGEALDYMSHPISTSMDNIPMHAMDHPVTSVGMSSNTIMRRVSVENLLSVPLSAHDTYSGSFDDRFPPEMDGFKQEDGSNGLPFGQETDDEDDDDVEEITRHDLDMNGGYGLEMNGSLFRLNSAFPDQITIPQRLDPLPQLLLGNKKNRMYFHHYLNYTAGLLVAHDCSDNPFKNVLPQMAVETDHLMNLLLAYSASHRARLLSHPEPTERIGRFLDETVRSLNVALNHPEDATSDASLATAIMLASYQIVSPNPFAANGLTWQMHLTAARKIIVSRGGAQGMHSGDTVSYFLVRWFAYLDLLGRLSGREIDMPLFSEKYWTNDNEQESDEYAVDCFFGFTMKCVSILAKIGELARRCEAERKELNESSKGLVTSNGMRSRSFHQWEATGEVMQEAQMLHTELQESRVKSLGRCGHNHQENEHFGYFQSGMHSNEFDQQELLATNDAFHWAAQIQLYRRVLNYPSDHNDVQKSVTLIIEAMYKVRPGGAAEACLLFPMFTAGCEATEFRHRDYILHRMVEVEKAGLTQFKHARTLMQRVWHEGVSWWEAVNGEFIG